MGVYLPEMDMPKKCYECRFRWFTEDDPQCAALWPERPLDGADHPDWCPLVDVSTPHGALIDRDKLTGEQYKDGHIMVVEMDAIEDAPTIIEAEE